MTVEDFITAFRSDLRDLTIPQMWSDEDIVRYLNDAVDEAAERALLIEDSVTADCCEVVLIPGQATYDLHPSVLRVKRATFNVKPLHISSVEAEDNQGFGWENREGPVPQKFIVNGQATTITFVPKPTEAGTVKLTVYRTGLTPLTTDVDTAEPELKAVYHPRLKDWMYRCAYLKRDAETLNEAKAAEHEAMFERAFGTRPSADTQRKRNDRRPPVVRFNSMW